MVKLTLMLSALFFVVAGVLAVIGFSLLSEATLGVGFIGLACLLAVFARIAQASAHHEELKRIWATE